MGPAEKSIEEKNLFIDQSLNDFRATVMEISEHIYVNPRSLEDRLYDKSEVIYMMQQIGHLQVPESVQMQAPAPKLGRINPTQKKQGPKSVPKNAPNPIAEFNDNDGKKWNIWKFHTIKRIYKVRIIAETAVLQKYSNVENHLSEFNLDKVNGGILEPMEEEDFSETVSEKTLSTSQGKSLFVLDKEEQLPNCSDICRPTPDKECIEEEA